MDDCFVCSMHAGGMPTFGSIINENVSHTVQGVEHIMSLNAVLNQHE